MTMKILSILLLTCFLKMQQISAQNKDYYWRQYTGSIPHDAYVAGQDINGRNIFIGQAYLKGAGLIVASIMYRNPVYATYYNNNNPHLISWDFIKILCAPDPTIFYWAHGSAYNLNNEMTGKRPIIGGYENGGILYVGRATVEGDLKVGKVTAYDNRPGQKKLYFVNKSGKEQGSTSYEVLVYMSTAPDVKLRTN